MWLIFWIRFQDRSLGWCQFQDSFTSMDLSKWDIGSTKIRKSGHVFSLSSHLSCVTSYQKHVFSIARWFPCLFPCLNKSCIKKPRIIGCKCMAQTYGKHTRLPNHQSLKKNISLVFRHCKLSLRMDFVDYILKHQREPAKNQIFSESTLFNQWKLCFLLKVLARKS